MHNNIAAMQNCRNSGTSKMPCSHETNNCHAAIPWKMSRMWHCPNSATGSPSRTQRQKTAQADGQTALHEFFGTVPLSTNATLSNSSAPDPVGVINAPEQPGLDDALLRFQEDVPCDVPD